jgi:glycine/D-amino acid oxidase-like deaminating enzyme
MRGINADAEVDVVIIGAGVQGLVILDTLSQACYACALVTEAEVGAGQTLHSHGFLNTGFGMLGDALIKAAEEIVHPYLRDRGVELSDNWVVLPPPASPGSSGESLFPALAALPPVSLPAGFSRERGATARKLADRSFNKRQLVEALIKDRAGRIIHGSVTGFQGLDPVEAVLVRPEGSETALTFATRAVVVAAGCGSKRLLRDLVGPTAQLDLIKHHLVHMVCLRAPHGALPATSVAALSLGLLLAAHVDRAGVTWYVTPMEMGGPSFDDVPNDAAAPAVPAMLIRAAHALLALYPPLARTPGLRVGHYAGYRQAIGEGPGMRFCAPVEGTANVIAALPSGLIGPWLNATDVLKLLRGLALPGAPSGSGRTLPPLLGGGVGVRVGQPVEDRPGFAWQTWQEWWAALPHLGASAGSAAIIVRDAP